MEFEEITSRVFAKLGKEKQLHEYLDIIYKLVGVVIDFISADGHSLRLSRGRRFNPFCSRLRDVEAGYRLCNQSDQENARTAKAKHKPLVYTCHAGLTEILVPLYSTGGRYIGSLTSGQFYLKDSPIPSDRHVKTLAQELKLNPEELLKLSKETLTLTPVQLQGLISYLETIGRLMVSTHHSLMFMESVNAPDKISQIKKYIEANYRNSLTMNKLARVFHFSPGYFSHFFRKEAGVGFNTYLNTYRISKAREMLDETELNISEIAFCTGFGSISQFNRVFRNICECSPLDYRRK